MKNHENSSPFREFIYKGYDPFASYIKSILIKDNDYVLMVLKLNLVAETTLILLEPFPSQVFKI